MSKKTSISGFSSNEICILCIVRKVQESLGRKTNWQTVKSSFWIKYSDIDLNIIFSNILSNIDNRRKGRQFISIFLGPSYGQLQYYHSYNNLDRHHNLTPPQISFSKIMPMILYIFSLFFLKYYPIHKVYLDYY